MAKLVEKGRIGFSIPTLAWIRRSLQEYDIRIVELTAEIAVESTLLSGMHADPAELTRRAVAQGPDRVDVAQQNLGRGHRGATSPTNNEAVTRS